MYGKTDLVHSVANKFLEEHPYFHCNTMVVFKNHATSLLYSVIVPALLRRKPFREVLAEVTQGQHWRLERHGSVWNKGNENGRPGEVGAGIGSSPGPGPRPY